MPSALLIVLAAIVSAAPTSMTTAPAGPKVNASPQLTKSVSLRPVKPLTKAKKLSLAIEKGVAASARLRRTRVLSPRRPFLDNQTYLSATGASMFVPHVHGSGLLVIPRVDHREASYKSNFVTVHFQAAPNAAYLVDCAVSEQGSYTVRVREGGKIKAVGGTHSGEHLSVVIREGDAYRMIHMQIFNEDTGYQLRQCEITPVY